MSGRLSQPPLVLTLGEPAGIAPDITIDAWSALRASGPAFILLGDPELIRRRAGAMGRSIDVVSATPEDAGDIFPLALPCQQIASVTGEAGRTSTEDAPAVIDSIRRSVELVHSGCASAIVTNPIQKKALDRVGFGFAGHTEYLGALAQELYGTSARPVMMIAGPELRVVPVTVHIPLAEVSEVLSSDLIAETGRVVAHDLSHRFGVATPRIAISGLNPHAGEEGMLGSEEGEIVAPAIAQLRTEGIDAFGPLPADTMFHPEARAGYDAALCMYHDQALIPIKTLAFDVGVNVTLGLPFVRTSPDHGTALSLAGTGRAKPDSLIASLRMADQLASGRKAD